MGTPHPARLFHCFLILSNAYAITTLIDVAGSVTLVSPLASSRHSLFALPPIFYIIV
jgi:uncharacterized membrane protein